MQYDSANPEAFELSQELFRIVNELLHPQATVHQQLGVATFEEAPFDISKPNQHDSKVEFASEYRIVAESIAALRKLVPLIIKSEDEGHQRTLDALEVKLNAKMNQGAPAAPVESAVDLVRRAVADAGGVAASSWVFIDFFRALQSRRIELDEQRDKFWNVPHRAPDYYARAIANRLAKLYAHKTGRKPTSGTSGMTGDASTSFTKALEQIFKLLEIRSGVRSPADWAIKHLSEEDFEPKMSGLANLGLGQRPGAPILGSILGLGPERSED
ncbi:hypothetical protein [Sulfitobacter geojensis]|uniref:hypothetical protein n=1 Tax=Sulfitobacter geojensis TaxID=1342299 RepID=UPI003B8B314F